MSYDRLRIRITHGINCDAIFVSNRLNWQSSKTVSIQLNIKYVNC